MTLVVLKIEFQKLPSQNIKYGCDKIFNEDSFREKVVFYCLTPAKPFQSASIALWRSWTKVLPLKENHWEEIERREVSPPLAGRNGAYPLGIGITPLTRHRWLSIRDTQSQWCVATRLELHGRTLCSRRCRTLWVTSHTTEWEDIMLLLWAKIFARQLC